MLTRQLGDTCIAWGTWGGDAFFHRRASDREVEGVVLPHGAPRKAQIAWEPNGVYHYGLDGRRTMGHPRTPIRRRFQEHSPCGQYLAVIQVDESWRDNELQSRVLHLAVSSERRDRVSRVLALANTLRDSEGHSGLPTTRTQ